jgi:hypothetical protein
LSCYTVAEATETIGRGAHNFHHPNAFHHYSSTTTNNTAI